MFKHLIALFMLAVSLPPAHGAKVLIPGDGQIDGRQLKPYELSWQQCSVQNDKWQSGGKLSEELIVIGDAILRHRQRTTAPDGTENRSDTFFDRTTLSPLRMERQVTKDGEPLVYIETVLTTDGYSGLARQGGKTKSVSGIISSDMLHGATMGLPLATMAWQKEPVTFLASMIGFDGTYEVTAIWIGKDKLLYEGKEIQTWMIDVDWLHRESGDVYPGGPDASGGRYWVVANPPVGFPHVPRYQTDTYAVEFVNGICPSPNAHK